MALRYIRTDEVSARNGVKVLVYGGSGTGKTRLCRTAPNPFILSAESGLLSLRKERIYGAEISTLDELIEAYNWIAFSHESKQFWTVCLDSVTEMAEIILANALKRVKDPRQAYGEVLGKTVEVIKCFRDLPQRHVYMSAKAEPMKDEMSGVVLWGPSMPGKKLGPALPYLFDEVFRTGVAKTPQGQTYGFLQTQADLQYVAKDRSGALAPLEPPDLNEVFNKIMR